MVAGGLAVWAWDPSDQQLHWYSPMQAVLGMSNADDAATERTLRELLAPLLLGAPSGGDLIEFENTLRLPRRADRRFKVVAEWMRSDTDGHMWLTGTLADVTNDRVPAPPAEVRDRYRLLIELSPDVIVVHCAGEIVFANRAAVALSGVESADALIGRSIFDFVAPESRAGLLARIAEMDASETHSEPAELHLLRLDGTRVPMESISVRTHWEERDAFQVIMRDLTAQKEAEAHHAQQLEAERARRAADARYSAAVAALDQGVVLIGDDGVVQNANPAALNLLGCPDLVGRPFEGSVALLDEDGAPLSPTALDLKSSRTGGFGHRGRIVAVRRDKDPLAGTASGDGSADAASSRAALTYLSMSVQALPSERGSAPFPLVVSLLDVTERHAAAALLRYEARHDHMTGLANRSELLETISSLLNASGAAGGVLFIDLDRFKMVNDSLGHEAGDAVLRVIARRLAADCPAGSTVGRLAGDEFVVVLPGVAENDMREFATNLLHRLREPVPIAGRELVVTCSMGIAMVTSCGASAPAVGMPVRVTATEVLRNADVAMYAAKQHGRNQIAAYDERLRRRAVDRLELQEDLRRAIERDDIRTFYQPIIRLADLSVVAVEALARWRHPDRGPVPPTAFIPIAEETGLIAALGEAILGQSAAQVHGWRQDADLATLQMSVNLSPRQLADPTLPDRIRRLLLDHELPACALTLEITESALMEDPDLAARTLTQLRRLGVGIAIDDFGTGYSSLSYLRMFPVTSVKIDRSFIDSLTVNEDGRAIVEGVVRLAHTLGLTVVAEGVETSEQLDVLRDLGCDYGQGYLFSRPVPAAELMPVLARVPEAEPTGMSSLRAGRIHVAS
jgi:diguanylate cyclase (GGDEF)-like protein/PAS domain S-box-containing protein